MIGVNEACPVLRSLKNKGLAVAKFDIAEKYRVVDLRGSSAILMSLLHLRECTSGQTACDQRIGERKMYR